MAERWIAIAEELAAKVKARLGPRGMAILSLLSLAWGIASGITLARDYAHSTTLVASFDGIVGLSAAFHVWLLYAQAVSRREQTPGGLRGVLLKRPQLVANAVALVTQSFVQYIVMFSLPLLFLAHAWITFALAATLVLISLMDPWWEVLSRQSWFMALIRSFCALIAASFAFAIWFPGQLAWFYPVLGAIALTAALPWSLLVQHRRPQIGEVIAVLGVALVIFGQAWTNVWLRVPLLSVWLRSPALGTDIRDHMLEIGWPGSISRTDLEAALRGGRDVCCLTPVVSPSGLVAPVTHEWLIDGQVIDRIVLPPVRGRGDADGKAYRTHSCKRHLPPPEMVHEITCRAVLGDDVVLGRVSVEVTP